MKKCSRCKVLKELSEFGRKTSNKDGLQNRCKPCNREASRLSYERHKARHLAKHREWVAKNPDYERDFLLKWRYGLTLEQYQRLSDLQGNKCAICGIHQDDLSKRLCVDHDHSCCPYGKGCLSCIRGLVCAQDNFQLGRLEKGTRAMTKEFADYLDAYKTRRSEGRTVLDSLSLVP